MMEEVWKPKNRADLKVDLDSLECANGSLKCAVNYKSNPGRAAAQKSSSPSRDFKSRIRRARLRARRQSPRRAGTPALQNDRLDVFEFTGAAILSHAVPVKIFPVHCNVDAVGKGLNKRQRASKIEQTIRA